MAETATKFKGMIFDGESVRGIAAGTKTMTRRMVVPQPKYGWTGAADCGGITAKFPSSAHERVNGGDWIRCPYGQPGSIVYVKEKWCEYGKGRAIYRADYGQFTPISDGIGGPWKSPRYMPRKFARLWLEIVAVKVERVQEISEEDAVAEGVVVWNEGPLAPLYFTSQAQAQSNELGYDDPRKAFAARWDAIHGDGAWEKNPWLWCYAFRKVEKP